MIQKNEHITALLPQYIDGILPAKQQKLVEAHLKNCNTCKEELIQYQTLFKAFEDELLNTPSNKLKSNFLKQLEAEKQQQDGVVKMNPSSESSFKLQVFLKIAAGIALLIGSFLMGKFHQSERLNRDIAALKVETRAIKQTAMLSLMENKSASKRIQGVNFVEAFSNPDEEIVTALTNRLLEDENTNVRLTAVEALAHFSESEQVKTAFIKALGTEKNPSVQIALIQNLVQLQEGKAATPMKRLLEKEDTQPFVRAEINRVLPQII
ncbi:HEAT repeat domain-containing protein [Maribacter sp. 2210JD10-5]|uniref:HEAT repeat domain-containing protein n=1 Tax=Maribacter sp. 2210JD10-5 TaxID=3386272 RepID=UPI0039BD353D